MSSSQRMKVLPTRCPRKEPLAAGAEENAVAAMPHSEVLQRKVTNFAGVRIWQSNVFTSERQRSSLWRKLATESCCSQRRSSPR